MIDPKLAERIVALFRRVQPQIQDWDFDLMRDVHNMIDELTPKPPPDPTLLYNIFADLDSPESRAKIAEASDRFLAEQKMQAEFFNNILPVDMCPGLKEMLTGQVELDPEARRILHEHRWELYSDGKGDPEC